MPYFSFFFNIVDIFFNIVDAFKKLLLSLQSKPNYKQLNTTAMENIKIYHKCTKYGRTTNVALAYYPIDLSEARKLCHNEAWSYVRKNFNASKMKFSGMGGINTISFIDQYGDIEKHIFYIKIK